MSVTPTGNSQLLHMKPDKSTSPPALSAATTTDASESVQPTSPIQSIGQLSQDTDSEIKTVTTDSETETSADNSIETAVDKLNSFMDSMNRDLEFEFDKEIGQTIVTIRDTTSKEVVRVIPSEIAVKLAKNLQENLENSEEPLGQLLDVKT